MARTEVRATVYYNMKNFKILICLILALVTLSSCTPADPYENQTVMSSESVSISRGEMAYFFIKGMRSTLSGYTSAELRDLGYDSAKPLKSQQVSGRSSTWYDLFAENASKYMRELVLLCSAAKKEGFELTAQDRLDEKLDDFKKDCEKAYSVSFERYLEIYFYGYVTEESYKGAIELELLANKYLDAVRDRIESSLTEERIKEQADASQTEGGEQKTRNLMTVYISEKEHESPLEHANALLSGLDVSEESFAELIKDHSDAENNLFENCKPGEMASEIDEWLFDAQRNVGDAEALAVTGGALILYYYSDGVSVAELEAILSLTASDYAIWFASVAEEFDIITNKEVLNSLDI